MTTRSIVSHLATKLLLRAHEHASKAGEISTSTGSRSDNNWPPNRILENVQTSL